MENQKKTSKALIAGIVAAVVLLAAVLALVLTQCTGGETGATTVPSTAGEEQVASYTLYWNLDRAEYDGKSEAGMSSRQMESDGYFHVRLFCEGEETVLKTTDRKVINKLDTMSLFGLELDENGMIADVIDVRDMPLSTEGWGFYVQSVGGKMLKLNSSDSYAGMELLLDMSEATVYDMTGMSGPVGTVAEPMANDRVYPVHDQAGVLTHVFLYDRTNYMNTSEAECQHCKEKVQWNEWTRADAFPSKPGHYQLMTDVLVSKQTSMANDVKLCLDLNGHTVESKNDIRIVSLHNPGTSFALMDTSEAQTGRMVGHSTASPQGGIVWVRYGQFHMYSGTLDGSDMVSRLNGTVVQVTKNAFFYMYGGEIIGGTAAPQYDSVNKKWTYGLGGSVQVSGTMRMYGGIIRDGKAPAHYYKNEKGVLTLTRGMGGNIFLSNGSVLEIHDGQILNGKAGNVGGNIMMDGTAQLIIKGGTISGGSLDGRIANKNGANIYCPAKGTIEMSGGTVSFGRAPSGGGGNIYLSGKMNLSGGAIAGGWAGKGGGNIMMVGSSQLYMSAGEIYCGKANGQEAGHGGGNITMTGADCKLTLVGGVIRDGEAVGLVNEDGTTLGGDGGNINVNRGTLVLRGGAIFGGKATGNGGGIYIGWNSTGLKLSQKTRIYNNEVTDIVRSNNTAKGKSQFLLGVWEGNGDKPAPVVDRLGGVAGSLVISPREETTFTEEDVAKFTSGKRVLPLELNANGNIVFAKPYLGEPDHTHCLCAGNVSHTCSDTGFVSVDAETFAQCWSAGTSANSLMGSLNMCLAEDVTISAEHAMSGNTLNLCLHGHTLTMEGNARLTANGTTGVLNITDCTGSGKIEAAEGCATSFLYTYKGKLNIYGGTMDGSKCAEGLGVVRVGYAGDEFTLYGGTIIGNKKATTGGSVYTSTSGSINILGGTIRGGIASTSGGGNIFMNHNGAVLNMSGGTIRDGLAANTGSSAGLGGNIHVIRGTLNLTGGTITGGTAKGKPDASTPAGTTGGIYLAYNAAPITLTGSVRIYGNGGSDIWLTSKAGYTLGVQDWNGNGSKGALNVGKTGAEAGTVLVTGDVSRADLEQFSSAHSGLVLKYSGSSLVLATPFVHDHCICAGKLSGHSCTTTDFVEVGNKGDFTYLFDGDKKLRQSVSIALTADITLDAEYTLGGNTLDLCLNGHTITMKDEGRITANGNGTLNITDCKDGKIAAAAGCRQSFLYTYNGMLNLYAGTIDASAIVLDKKDTKKSGGAVNVYNANDEFHMYGGEIVGATIYRAGGVFAYYGTFYMHGGRISGGNADLGGGVATDRGAFAMEGGVITACSADTNGAAVMTGYNSSSKVILSGEAKIYGNTGANDIYSGQKAVANQTLVLDNWKGNGANGALVIASRDGKAGSVMAVAKEGTLTETQLGMLASGLDGLKLALNADGAIVLEEIIYHQHCICGGVLAGTEGHTCETVTFTEVTTAEEFAALFENGVLKADATVVLMGSIELTGEYKMGGKTLNLCLNDQTITMSGSGRITANGGGTLNVSACNGGKVVAAEGATPGLLYTYTGTLNFYSGTVDASKCASGNGGTITLGNTGDKVNIYGGTFKGNQKSRNGANLYSSGAGTLTVYGGTFNGGKAIATKADNGLGGLVCMTKGHLVLLGGTFTGGSANGKANDADTAGLSGGIYIPYNGTLTLSGNAKIYGNTGCDIYLSSRTDKAIFTLGDWEGNGSHGALKIGKLQATDGTQLIAPAADALTASDAAKFAYITEGTALVVDAKGGLSLKQMHYHCVCDGKVSGNDTHTCEKLTWMELGASQFLALFGTDKKLTASHTVVLTEDVTMDAEYALNGNTLNLCLGGHTITMTGNGRLTANGTTGVLNLAACDGGKIEAAEGARASFLFVYKGVLNLYGGTVDATKSAAGNGGAITVGYAGDKLNIFGGTIIGSQKGTAGGSIYMAVNGTITMYSGTVKDGKTTGGGGNLHVAAGETYIKGGTITDGTGACGGNIHVYKTAKLFVEGGTISDGESNGTKGGYGGGNIYLGDGAGTTGSVTISGGTISGGTSGLEGGNINVNRGSMTVTGGTITGGSSDVVGGGIYVGWNSTGVTISGNTLIYGNEDTDICRCANTNATLGILLLGDWAGNGEHGAAKLDTLFTATGKTVIAAAGGYTLTEADLAKFECVGTYGLALSGGKFITAEK